MKKLLASFLLAIVLLTNVFVPSAQAQGIDSIFGEGPWYNQSMAQFYTKVHEEGNPTEIFGERYTFAQVDWIVWSTILWLPTKIVGQKFWYCVFSDSAVDCIKNLLASAETENGTALALLKNQSSTVSDKSNKNIFQAVFEDRSFSGITYVKQRLNRFSFIPEAKAQSGGFGFNYGFPDVVQDLWRGFRNISFGLFVLVTIVFAFMIMFRVKISPQVVISVQSALPKIIITLLLVTFSYAIAGFLIDLMYVVYGIIGLALSSTPAGWGGPQTPTQIFYFMTRGRFLPGALGDSTEFGVLGLILVFLVLFSIGTICILMLSGGVIGLAAAGITTAVGTAIATLISGGSFGVIAGLLALLILVVVLIILIVHVFRILWLLLKTFATVMLLTIFAPLQITLGALVPSMGFGKWLKSYISNLSIFITTSVLFYFSFFFLSTAVTTSFENFFGNTITNIIFGGLFGYAISGDMSDDWPPLLGGGNNPQMVAFLFLGVSFVLFIIIPKTADLIKSLIDGKPFAYGAAIGEVAAPVVTAGKLAGTGIKYGEQIGETFDAAKAFSAKMRAARNSKSEEAEKIV